MSGFPSVPFPFGDGTADPASYGKDRCRGNRRRRQLLTRFQPSFYRRFAGLLTLLLVCLPGLASAWPGWWVWGHKDGYACSIRRFATGKTSHNLNVSRIACEDDDGCSGVTDFTPNGGAIAFCGNG